MVADRNLTSEEGLPRFYAGMRKFTRCRLSALTARTYLNYVISGLRLHPRHPTVRSVRKVASRQAAIEDPVRPVKVETEASLIECALQMPEGPVRRAAILMLCTGARCADVAHLKADEIVVHEASSAVTRMEIAWSEQKARKEYGSRVTIAYPSAMLGSALSMMLKEIADLSEAPCPGVTSDAVNAALRSAGSMASTRSFRVRYIAAAQSHILATNSTTPLQALTGHHSGAIPSAVYLHHHVRDASRRQKMSKATRAAVPTGPQAPSRRTSQIRAALNRRARAVAQSTVSAAIE
jgi:hypothetical protein